MRGNVLWQFSSENTPRARDFCKKENTEEVSHLVPLSHPLVTRRVLLKADLKIVCMANANRVSFVFLPE